MGRLLRYTCILADNEAEKQRQAGRTASDARKGGGESLEVSGEGSPGDR